MSRGAPATVAGNPLPPLLTDAVQSSGAFASLNGRGFDGRIRRGELPNALHLTRDEIYPN